MQLEVEPPVNEDDCWIVRAQPDFGDFWLVPGTLIGSGPSRAAALRDLDGVVSRCINAFNDLRKSISADRGTT